MALPLIHPGMQASRHARACRGADNMSVIIILFRKHANRFKERVRRAWGEHQHGFAMAGRLPTAQAASSSSASHQPTASRV